MDDIKGEINKGVYKNNFKERPHISKSKLDDLSDVKYLKVNELQKLHYSNELSTRYIAAMDLTYDVILSLFDYNSRQLLVYRFFITPTLLKSEVKKFLDSFKNRPNMEARIIGLQNGQDHYLILDEIGRLLLENKIKLVEVDLFGSNVRHIAMDSKLGMDFDILKDDRLYKPGELANNMTLENFEHKLNEDTDQQA